MFWIIAGVIAFLALGLVGLWLEDECPRCHKHGVMKELFSNVIRSDRHLNNTNVSLGFFSVNKTRTYIVNEAKEVHYVCTDCGHRWSITKQTQRVE